MGTSQVFLKNEQESVTLRTEGFLGVVSSTESGTTTHGNQTKHIHSQNNPELRGTVFLDWAGLVGRFWALKGVFWFELHPENPKQWRKLSTLLFESPAYVCLSTTSN